MNLWLSENGQIYDAQGQTLTYWVVDEDGVEDDDVVLSPANAVGITINYQDENGNEGSASIVDIESYGGLHNSITGAPFKYSYAYLLEAK